MALLSGCIWKAFGEPFEDFLDGVASYPRSLFTHFVDPFVSSLSDVLVTTSVYWVYDCPFVILILWNFGN